MAIVELTTEHMTIVFDTSKRLGEGGTGIVYRGKEKTTGKSVTIKSIYPELASNKEMIDRIKRVASISIRHDNIKQMYGYVEKDGVHNVIGEYMEGVSLDQYIRQQQGLELREAIHIMVQVLMGLEALHKRKIIHRDIKPSNIFKCSNSRIKIFDFGIARVEQHQGEKWKTLTRTGSFVGTPYYMAPEQIRGENNKINETTDIYATGITFYEMLVGNPPFTATNAFDTLSQHIRDPLPKNTNIPTRLFVILAKATAKDQDRRYKNATLFKKDIQQYAKELPPEPSKPEPKPKPVVRKSKIKRREVFLILLLVITSCSTIWFYFQNASSKNAEDVIPAEDSVKITITKPKKVVQRNKNIGLVFDDFNEGEYFEGDAGLEFNVYQPCTLKSVAMYSQHSGNIYISLYREDSLLYKVKKPVSGKLERIYLNFPLKVGNHYRILAEEIKKVKLFRQQGKIDYPYTIPDVISITGSTGTKEYYYYFYQWDIKYHENI